MDFYVVMGRPGNRVARRRRATSRVGPQHRVTKDESIKWFQTTVHACFSFLCFATHCILTDFPFSMTVSSLTSKRPHFVHRSGKNNKNKTKTQTDWFLRVEAKHGKTFVACVRVKNDKCAVRSSR